MMNRVEQIISSMPEGERDKVLALRARFSQLMKLEREKVLRLQLKAIFIDYLEGAGRKLDVVPHQYEVSDGRGGTYAKETYFTYFDRVH